VGEIRSIPTGHPPPLQQIAGQIRCSSGFTVGQVFVKPPQQRPEAVRRPVKPDAEKVLTLLEGVSDGVLPTQMELAGMLGLSRAAIQTHMAALNDCGDIEYVTVRRHSAVRLPSGNVLRTRGCPEHVAV
jgi:biotin operon repressor